MPRWSALLPILLGLAMSSPSEAQTSRGAALPLRVGASKVDVTPSGIELPKNGFGILDRLYARAVVLDNSAATAALVRRPSDCARPRDVVAERGADVARRGPAVARRGVEG